VEAPSGERLRAKGRHHSMVFIAGKTERFKVVCIPCKALYKCSAFCFMKDGG